MAGHAGLAEKKLFIKPAHVEYFSRIEKCIETNDVLDGQLLMQCVNVLEML